MSKTVIKGLAMVATAAGLSNVCSATMTVTANTVDSTIFGEETGHDEVVLYFTKELSIEGYCGTLLKGDGVTYSFNGETGTGMVTSSSVTSDPGSLTKSSVTIRCFEPADSTTPTRAPGDENLH